VAAPAKPGPDPLSRKSLFWPTLWSGIGLVILLSLGTWQLARLQWKEGLIAAREAGLHSAPTDLPTTLAAARALEFHPVRAAGEFLNDRELYVNDVSDNGAAGF
jgi:surfeit locus 1 family protein